MGNMSYCRFQNTALDLDDCADALEDIFLGQDETLSRDECKGFARLMEGIAKMIETISINTGMENDEIVEAMGNDARKLVEKLMSIQPCNPEDDDDC